MSEAKPLPDIVSEIYKLLDPLESQDRQKVIGSAMTLLGEQAAPASNSKTAAGGTPETGENGDSVFGVKASRWMNQNDISQEMIEEVFHSDGADVEVIASKISGTGKRDKTHNCYLLVGIRALLANDEAKFSDDQAVELCKTMGCFDRSNQAKYRNDLGNIVAGSKNSGFTLPAPGLRAAATTVKSIVGSD